MYQVKFIDKNGEQYEYAEFPTVEGQTWISKAP